MTDDRILDYCLSKPGAYVCFPFGDMPVCVKVKNRLFAQVYEDKATFNCTVEAGMFWRDLYPGTVTRGYHCPPVQQPYFNTVMFSAAVPDEELYAMADHSYETVVHRLSKKLREELEREKAAK